MNTMINYEEKLSMFEEMTENKLNDEFNIPKELIGPVTRSINELKGINKLSVVFKVPENIKRGLKNGTYIRKGGVIVKKKNNEVVMWLKEGKNLSKAGTILLSAIDIFSEIALNEKLKQILDIVKELSFYVETRHNALFNDAKESLLLAGASKNEEEKKHKLREANAKFREFKVEKEKFLKRAFENMHKKILSFESRRHTSNQVETTKLVSSLKEIINLNNIIMQISDIQIRIQEELEDFEAADKLRHLQLKFICNMNEYMLFFTGEIDASYNELNINKNYSIRTSKKIMGGFAYSEKDAHTIFFINHDYTVNPNKRKINEYISNLVIEPNKDRLIDTVDSLHKREFSEYKKKTFIFKMKEILV